MDDVEISALLTRLARPHASGGVVVERAAILAEGGDFAGVMRWITAHDGTAEAPRSAPARHGLHGARLTHGNGTEASTPLRFVLPPGALV